MIREIQGEIISVKKMDNNRLNIVCGKVDYKIPGMGGDEFPEVDDAKDVNFSEIPSNVLKDMISKTSFAISTDEMRVNLNGVFFRVDNGLIEMVATDGHR